MDLIGLEDELKRSGDSISGTKNPSNVCHKKILKAGKAKCSIILWPFP